MKARTEPEEPRRGIGGLRGAKRVILGEGPRSGIPEISADTPPGAVYR